ncbi:serine protease [Lithospermum erythrorhizon]|uniref:Serine protease n=1 Tax=Lithospermum erythrorhizon TaxID=34254 RepID=A0AAV3PFP5_LITER
MLSLLWKGIQLETSMGSAEFASMVAVLLGMSQGITLLLAKSLLHFFNYKSAYYYEYSVGFSGVLFAMKIVLNAQSDNYTNVYGVLVPTRYAAWAELILIQMFVPHASFLGHLGGILAGLVYLNIKNSLYGPSQPTRVIRYLFSMVGWPIRFVRHLFGFRRRNFGRGNVGGSETRSLSGVWRCSACTYDNPDWFSTCEMCGTEQEDGHPSHEFADQSDEISLEELRRRRVQRFGR